MNKVVIPFLFALLLVPVSAFGQTDSINSNSTSSNSTVTATTFQSSITDTAILDEPIFSIPINGGSIEFDKVNGTATIYDDDGVVIENDSYTAMSKSNGTWSEIGTNNASVIPDMYIGAFGDVIVTFTQEDFTGKIVTEYIITPWQGKIKTTAYFTNYTLFTDGVAFSENLTLPNEIDFNGMSISLSDFAGVSFDRPALEFYEQAILEVRNTLYNAGAGFEYLESVQVNSDSITANYFHNASAPSFGQTVELDPTIVLAPTNVTATQDPTTGEVTVNFDAGTSVPPFLSDDFSSSSGWTQTHGTKVSVTNGQVYDNNSHSAEHQSIHKPLGQTLGESWTADFEWKKTAYSAGEAILLAFTDSPTANVWQNSTSDALAVVAVDSGVYQIFARDGTGSDYRYSTGISLPANGTWHYLTFERTGTTTATLYVYSDSARTNLVGSSTATISVGSAVTGLDYVTMGGYYANGSVSYRTITWEGDNLTVADTSSTVASPTSYDVFSKGAGTNYRSHEFGNNSWNFDASSGNGYGVTTNAVNTSVDQTYSMWLKFPIITTNYQWASPIKLDNTTQSASCWYPIMIDKGSGGSSSNHWLGAYKCSGTGFVSSGFDLNTLSSGWHHLTTVVDGGTAITHYIDGTQVSTQGAIAGYYPQGSATVIGDTWSGGNENIGHMDDLGIWNTTLSQSDITSLAQGTSPNSIQTNNLLQYYDFENNTSLPNLATGSASLGSSADGTLVNASTGQSGYPKTNTLQITAGSGDVNYTIQPDSDFNGITPTTQSPDKPNYVSTITNSFNQPNDVAFDSNDNFWVADIGGHKVHKFDSSGTLLLTIGTGSGGSGNNEFNNPYGVAVDSNDNLFVADRVNQRVQKFDSSGNYQATISGQTYTQGVAVDSNDNIWIANTNSHNIKKYDSSLNLVTTFGSQGSGNNQFYYPHDLAVASNGDVWVADRSNNRVQKFDSSLNYQFTIGGLNAPFGIEINSLNHAVFGDTFNDQVKSYDSSGTLLWTLGTGVAGSGNDQFDWASGIAFDSKFNMYVADFNNNRVQKFGVPLTGTTNLGTGTYSVTGDVSLIYDDDEITATGGTETAWNIPAPVGQTVFNQQRRHEFAPDSLGSSVDGTNNGATTGVTGYTNNAWEFSNDYVDLGHTILSGTGDFSSSAMFKTSGNSGDIWSSYSSGAGAGGNELYILSNGLLNYWHTTGGSHNGTTTLNHNQWYNVIVVNDGGAFTMYLDGSVENTSTVSGSIAGTNMLIGGINGSGSFNGTIDDVVFWDRALTSAEITALQSDPNPNNLTNTDNLLAYYDFEDTGSTLTNQAPTTSTFQITAGSGDVIYTIQPDGAFNGTTNNISPIIWDTSSMVNITENNGVVTGGTGTFTGKVRSVIDFSTANDFSYDVIINSVYDQWFGLSKQNFANIPTSNTSSGLDYGWSHKPASNGGGNCYAIYPNHNWGSNLGTSCIPSIGDTYTLEYDSTTNTLTWLYNGVIEYTDSTIVSGTYYLYYAPRDSSNSINASSIAPLTGTSNLGVGTYSVTGDVSLIYDDTLITATGGTESTSTQATIPSITNLVSVGTPYDASDSNLTYADKHDFSSHSTNSIAMASSPDGTHFYVNEEGGGTHQFDLSTAWDISTAVWQHEYTHGLTNPKGLFFSADGTKMFEGAFSSGTIYRYPLATPWDVSTVQSSDQTYGTGNIQDLFFSADGTKMFWSDNSGNVNKVNLGTPWTINSNTSTDGTYSGSGIGIGAVIFSADGTKMYLGGWNSSGYIKQYTLSTAWQISSGVSFTQNYTESGSQLTDMQGMVVSSTGDNFYILDQTNDYIRQYNGYVLVPATEYSEIPIAGIAEEYTVVANAEATTLTPITWDASTGVNVSINGNAVNNNGGGAWGTFAESVEIFNPSTGGVTMEFQASTDNEAFMGLGQDPHSPIGGMYYATFDYGVNPHSGGITVYENGVNVVGGGSVISPNPSWSSSDVIKIIMDGNGLVTYYYNDVLFWTSVNTASGDYYAQASHINNPTITANISNTVPISSAQSDPALINTFNVPSQVVNLNAVDGLPIGLSWNTGTAGANVIQEVPHKVHTFTSSSNFQITAGSGDVDYLVVAGGGGSGARIGGGGAGGGMLEGTASNLGTGTYTVTVGAGGAGGIANNTGAGGQGTNGDDSVFDNITALGGGGGGRYVSPPNNGVDGSAGGSGGGAGGIIGSGVLGGAGTSGQGYAGGTGATGASGAGAGGGAGGIGGTATSGSAGGVGGIGLQSDINGTLTYYAGGGGGSADNNNASGGLGGGGQGGAGNGNPATAGTPNTGGGGGGQRPDGLAGTNGGSGIVIVRYVDDGSITATGGTITTTQATASVSSPPVISYDVIRDGTVIATVSAPTTSYTDNNVLAGQTYDYQIVASAVVGSGIESLVATGQTVSPANAPTNFTVTHNSSGELVLGWTGSNDLGGGSLVGIQIERSTNAGTSWGAINSSLVTSPYTDTNVTMGTEYHYRIASINEAGIGTYSTIEFNTAGIPADAPTNLTTAINNPNPSPLIITLSWVAPSNMGTGALSGYEIIRDGVPIHTTTGSGTTYNDTVPNAGTFVYEVKTITSHGTGLAGNQSSINTPTVPTPPTVVVSIPNPNPTPLGVQLVITPPTSDGGSAITNYDVFRSDDNFITSTQIQTGTNTLTFTDTVPNAGTWWYNTSVNNNVGNSGGSPIVSIATPTVPPAPATASSDIPDRDNAPFDVVVSWTVPPTDGGSAIIGYNIYRTDVGLVGSTAGLTVNDTLPSNASTNFTYHIHAVNNVGEGTWRDTVITTSGAPANPVIAVVNGSTLMTWTAPSDGGSAITGYEIYRDSTGVPVLIDTIGVATSYHDQSTISFGTLYVYSIKAINNVATSGFSNPVGTTPVLEIDDLTALPSYNTVRVTWSEPEYYQGNVGHYAIFKDGTWATNTQNTYFDVTGLVENTSYQFYIAVYSQYANPSGNSNTVSATTTANPAEVGFNPDDQSLTVDWIDLTATNTDRVNDTEYLLTDLVTGVTQLDILYPTHYNDMTCQFDYKYAGDKVQYTDGVNMNSAPVSGVVGSQTVQFLFTDADKEVISIQCADPQVEDSKSFYVMTQDDFPLLQQVDAFKEGDFGTDASFGALDLVSLFAIIITMVGFNRVHPLAGVIIGVSLMFVLAGFEIIQTSTAVGGIIIMIVLLAVGAHRRWGN